MLYNLVDYPNIGNLYGNYKGKTPKSAASKILTFLAKKHNISSNTNKLISFTIKNIKTGKEYSYVGNRIKLDKPIEVIINGKKINYWYKNTLTCKKCINI